MSSEVATGVNIYKKGQDPPILSDSEYPEWLWELEKKPKTLKQLQQQAKDGGGFECLPPKELFRLIKLERKAAIKAHNEASRKRKE